MPIHVHVPIRKTYIDMDILPLIMLAVAIAPMYRYAQSIDTSCATFISCMYIKSPILQEVNSYTLHVYTSLYLLSLPDMVHEHVYLGKYM